MLCQYPSCALCGTTTGMFTCRGCSQTFCLAHTNQHREALDKELDRVIVSYKCLHESVKCCETERYIQKLVDQVNVWEEQSRDKIHCAADKIRSHLSRLQMEYRDHTDARFTKLCEELNIAQGSGCFFEKELDEWKCDVEKLENQLIEQRNIQISYIDTGKPFIPKIEITDRVANDCVETMISDKCVRDCGEYDCSQKFDPAVEYTYGRKSFRMKFKSFERNCLYLVGIISASKARDTDPFRNPTFYGWSKDDIVYLHGTPYATLDNYRSDIGCNDVFCLVLDCENRVIRLTNERTYKTYELKVDTCKCPFPWRPHVCMTNCP